MIITYLTKEESSLIKAHYRLFIILIHDKYLFDYLVILIPSISTVPLELLKVCIPIKKLLFSENTNQYVIKCTLSGTQTRDFCV